MESVFTVAQGDLCIRHEATLVTCFIIISSIPFFHYEAMHVTSF